MDTLIDYVNLLNSYLTTSQLRTLYSITTYANRTLLSLFNNLRQNPSLGSIVLLIVILFLSMHILNMALQVIRFWVRLAIRLLFWGTLVGVGTYLYVRGPEGATRDAQYWIAHWRDQYDEYALQAKTQKKFGGGKAHGGGLGFGGW